MGDRAICRDEDDLAPVGNLTISDSHHINKNKNSISYSHLRTALIGCFLSAFLTASLIVIAVLAKIDPISTAFVAVVFGVGVGATISGVMLPRQQREERRRLEEYYQHLKTFHLDQRDHSLESLRLSSADILGQISTEVHRIITGAYRGYRESRHLRKTLLSAIEKETRKAKSRLDHVAYLDALTGLANRRSFDETAAEIITDMRLLTKDVICLTVDIDYFKEVNDLIGHDRGDAVLRFLADSIRSVIRDSDRAYRLGGDEFVILLTNLSLEQASEVAQRLQKLFAQMPWNHGDSRKPSLSIGGASMDTCRAVSLEELVKQSDRAMYGAKRAGKACENILGFTAGRAA